jgi:AcrR family transcriptional regulator
MVKKQLLIEKALELFAKQGIEATSVQQITDLCGISKGAFYLSFKSKEELIVAMVNQFILRITSEIDYSVRHCESPDELLYTLYMTSLQQFDLHIGFAKVFIQEPAHTPNEALVNKFIEFDRRINSSIFYVLRQLYPELPDERKYDLAICIKNFLRMYVELKLQYRINLKRETFVESMVEKTVLLVQSTRLMAPEGTLAHLFEESGEFLARLEPEQIIALIDRAKPEVIDPIELESLDLLRQGLQGTASPGRAIIKGLLENVRHNPACRRLASAIREYYRL